MSRLWILYWKQFIRDIIIIKSNFIIKKILDNILFKFYVYKIV